MPKIDVDAIAVRVGTGYPEPLNRPCAERTRKRLGNAVGLQDFGVNLMTLPPGGWSSQRHWHSEEDEFVFVVGETSDQCRDQPIAEAHVFPGFFRA